MKAAVVGTGMMGPGIAMTLTLGGIDAVILGRTPESAEAGLATARRQLALLAESDLVTPEQRQFSEETLRASTAFDDEVSASELVIESGPENMAFKQDLFARMDSLTRPECLLTSNTSGLSITSIAERCVHPERVMTTHFWNPPHLMPLVEIVMGAKTAPDAAARMRGLLERCGKVPVLVKKDTPGQLGNRLQMAMVREAAHIVSAGIADAEEVDLAVRMGFGMRLPMYGLLEHMDIVGLDMAMAILRYVSTDLYNDVEPPERCRELLESGNLGAKTGKGFYDWSVKSADETRARRDAFVLRMLRWQRAGRS
ncbi:MAG: 3-hydroxyacyl-CoA dehydrogenase family protein [Acidobacteria bacterium]|nr:3-hydroxyacyl-CoA dehydrogenase family protein [Acidobacteriota bacterium]